jgi:hypothetical protein
MLSLKFVNKFGKITELLRSLRWNFKNLKESPNRSDLLPHYNGNFSVNQDYVIGWKKTAANSF